MSQTRWLQVKTVLAGALEESPDRRSAFLDDACGDDAALRAEVESLLRAEILASTFLEQPLLDRIAANEPEPRVGLMLGSYVIEDVRRPRRHGRGVSRPTRRPGVRAARRDQDDPARHGLRCW